MDAVYLEWRRQFATSRKARVVILTALGVLAASFAVFLWWFAGAWIILPFAGLEIGCVVFAFWWLEQAADDRDSVEIAGSRVTIIRSRRKASQRIVFDRSWLSAELNCDLHGISRGVRLRQSGRGVELLEFLPVIEQARALKDRKSVV